VTNIALHQPLDALGFWSKHTDNGHKQGAVLTAAAFLELKTLVAVTTALELSINSDPPADLALDWFQAWRAANRNISIYP
jgi:hypothetical protein